VKAVGLTFDDGPHPAVTPAILKVLRLHDARGTFFLLGGRIPEREWIVHQIVDEGHEIGNHLLTDVPSIRLAPTEFERQLLETHRLLSRFAPVRWFRPGSAWFNCVMLDQLRRHGYRCVLGSVYAFDAQVPIVAYVARHILCNVRPGAIIVLHEGTAERIRTAAVLRRVLPELNSRGYKVATLSELGKLSCPPQ